MDNQPEIHSTEQLSRRYRHCTTTTAHNKANQPKP